MGALDSAAVAPMIATMPKARPPILTYRQGQARFPAEGMFARVIDYRRSRLVDERPWYPSPDDEATYEEGVLPVPEPEDLPVHEYRAAMSHPRPLEHEAAPVEEAAPEVPPESGK